LVLVLFSGGRPRYWAAPVASIELDAKTALTRGLLKCGADIHEMNTVRATSRASRAGDCARPRQHACYARHLRRTGRRSGTIGSGPTVPDATTLADARAVLAKRRSRMEALGLPIPAAVEQALADAGNETPKPDDPAFATAEYRLIATPAASITAAADLARTWGYEVVDLGDALTGEASEVARAHAELARAAKAAGRKLAIISGGELNVTVRNAKGRGGRNQEYALALAIALGGLPGVAALAADTDGIDGGEGPRRRPCPAPPSMRQRCPSGEGLGPARLDAQMFHTR
jgi:hydroxypyruvate reductase